MVKVVGLGGEPGSGKSTVMSKVIESFSASKALSKGIVRGHIFPDDKVIVLGIYDGSVFQGTDRLSMAVQPEVIKFIKSLHNHAKYDNWRVLLEGDRLFSVGLFTACSEAGIPMTLFKLEATPENLKTRRQIRGSNQNERWLKGRCSKIQNVCKTFNVLSLPNNTKTEFAKAVNALAKP